MRSISLFVLTGFVCALFGWAGVIYLVLFTLPYLGPRWGLFFLNVFALSGIAMPIVAYLNQRFPTKSGMDQNAIIRQALWVGIYGDILIWLQLGRVLTFNKAVFLMFGIILIEALLRLRESSRWRPKASENE